MNEQIVARIKANVPIVKQVGEAADFQTAVENNPKVTPACFVISLAEQPELPAFADLMQQTVRVAVGVVIVIKNVADVSGAAAKVNLDAVRNQVKDQLFGWVPAPGFDPLSRGASNLLVFKDGYMWWQDVYLTSYFDRSVL
jgi:hypothetical protein